MALAQFPRSVPTGSVIALSSMRPTSRPVSFSSPPGEEVQEELKP
jgi:hypothetical protein